MPERDLALQHGKVVLLEEPDELVGEAPAGLVVVLDHERLTRSGGRRLGRAPDPRRDKHREYRPTHHGSLLSVSVSVPTPGPPRGAACRPAASHRAAVG